MPMIKVKDISKTFGDILALQNLSFHVHEGEIFGFLGPNGAGKSTTINILNTLLKPDSGQVFINGHHLEKHQHYCKGIIGVVPQEIALYEDLSAYQNLIFWGSLYNITDSNLKIEAERALEMVGLSDRKNHPIKTYSGGMKRRINIASSILHRPKVLLMDEPTVGVDPQSRNHIFEVIERLSNEGVTIIYTTHYMEEAERLCDTIAIIDIGKIVAQGTLSELRNSSNTKDLLQLKLSDLNQQQVDQIVSTFPSSEIDYDANSVSIMCLDISSEISGIISGLLSMGVEIKSIDTRQVNLETIFLNLTGKQLRD